MKIFLKQWLTVALTVFLMAFTGCDNLSEESCNTPDVPEKEMGFVIKLPGRAERVSYWTKEDATEYSLKLIKDKVLIDAAKGTPGQSVKFVVAEEGEYAIAVSAYSEDILIAEGSSTASIHDGDGFVTVDVYLVPKAKETNVDVEIHWQSPEEQQDLNNEPHENQNSNNEPVMYEVQVETFLNYDIPDTSFNQYVILDKTHFIAGDEVSIKVKYDGQEYVFKNISVLNISTGEKFNLGPEDGSFIMPESDVCVHVDFLKLYKVSFSDSGEYVSVQYVPYGETVEPDKTLNSYSRWDLRTFTEFSGWYVNNDEKKPFDFSTPIKHDYEFLPIFLTSDFSAYEDLRGGMYSYENNTVVFSFSIPDEDRRYDATRYTYYNTKLVVLDAENNLYLIDVSSRSDSWYESHLSFDLSSLKAGEYNVFLSVQDHVCYYNTGGDPWFISDITNIDEYINERFTENIFYKIHIDE